MTNLKMIYNMTIEDAYINGFIKAALGEGGQIPALGAMSNMSQPNPAMNQPGPQATRPAQPSQPQNQSGAQQLPFYQLLSQFRQQNPMSQVPGVVPNLNNKPFSI
jgi:hypothetical protein